MDADPHRHPSRLAPLGVVAAASLWGTAGAAQELGAPDVAPWTVASVRGTIGGLALLGLAAAAGRWRGVTAIVRRAPGAAAVTGLALAVFQICYLGGIRLTGVAVGTLVAIASAPVWAGLLALVRGRPPGRRWLLGTVLTLAGTAALVLPTGGAEAVDPAGVALGLVAGLAFATYAVASKHLLDLDLVGLPIVAVAWVGAGILLAPLLVVADASFLTTVDGALAMAWLTLVATALAYLLFVRGLAGVDAPTATTLSLAEPLTAALLGVLVVGERLGGMALAGAALLAAGLVLAGTRPVGPVPAVPDPPDVDR